MIDYWKCKHHKFFIQTIKQPDGRRVMTAVYGCKYIKALNGVPIGMIPFCKLDFKTGTVGQCPYGFESAYVLYGTLLSRGKRFLLWLRRLLRKKSNQQRLRSPLLRS